MLLGRETPGETVSSDFGSFVKQLAREYMVDNPDRRCES